MLYLAWITAAESDANLDKAIELATSARNLAATKDNYLVFIQASTFIGHADVHKGQVELRHPDNGTRASRQVGSGRGPAFKRPASYQAAAALPFSESAIAWSH